MKRKARIVIKPGASTQCLRGIVSNKDGDRFDKMTAWDGQCLVWKGHRDKKGYGQFKYKGRAWWSHRFAYAAFVGSIPEDMTIDHICCNPSCVNPAHLRLMCRSDNTALGNVARDLPEDFPV